MYQLLNFCLSLQDVPLERDEAGYDLVNFSKGSKKSPTKKSPTKKGSKLGQSSSAEHLYETADLDNNTTGSKPPHNSPQVAGNDSGLEEKRIQERKVLNGPPEPHELPEGMDQDHLYAQVVNSIGKRKPPKDGDNSMKMDKPEASSGQGPENRDKKIMLSSLHEAQGLVVTYHQVSVGVKGAESTVPSKDIEHLASGNDMYAVVHSVSKKKKLNKTKSLSLESSSTCVEQDTLVVPQREEVTCEENNTTLDDGGKNETKKEEDESSCSVAVKRSNSSPDAKPKRSLPIAQKPRPALNRPLPFSPKDCAKVEERPEVQNPDKIPSLVHSAPPPKGSKVDAVLPPSPSNLSPTKRTRANTLSSRPPAFPPPPPPDTTPSANGDIDVPDDVNDPMYAVVDQKPANAKWNQKKGQEKLSEQLVHNDSAAHASHMYVAVDTTTGKMVEEKEPLPSVPVRRSLKRKNNNSLRKYPTLPAKQTPPPPPPPLAGHTPSLASQDQVNGSPGPFLFPKEYAMIKVSVTIQQ